MELGRQFKDFVTPDQVFTRLENLDKRFGTSFSDPRSVGIQKTIIEREDDLGGLPDVSSFMEVPTFEGSLRDVEGTVLHKSLGDKNIDLMSEPVAKVPHSTFLFARTGGVPRPVETPERVFIRTPEHASGQFFIESRVAQNKEDLRKKMLDLQSTVRDNIVETENFGKSLSEAHSHLRSPQLQNTISRLTRNYPTLGSGRFVEVSRYGPWSKHYGNRGVISNTPTRQDFIDLQTGTWAKIDPEGYFPDGDTTFVLNRDWL